MHTDPIADLLTRIRNAEKANHEQIFAPYSRFKENLLKVLQEKEFIKNYTVEDDKPGQKILIVNLREDAPKLSLKRISKPGQRIYIKKEDLKSIRSGLGISIVSTSKGLMTNTEARKLNLGGELICEIY